MHSLFLVLFVGISFPLVVSIYGCFHCCLTRCYHNFIVILLIYFFGDVRSQSQSSKLFDFKSVQLVLYFGRCSVPFELCSVDSIISTAFDGLQTIIIIGGRSMFLQISLRFFSEYCIELKSLRRATCCRCPADQTRYADQRSHLRGLMDRALAS